MRTTMSGPSTASSLLAVTLLLPPLSQARPDSQPSIWRRAIDHTSSLLNRRQDDSSTSNDTTTIPSALSIAPSQYWDGIDGPWSSFPIQAGTPAQNERVFISTAATQVLTIQALGCPEGYVEDCDNSRGFLFLTNESLTWIANSKYNAAIEENLGLDTTGDAGFDTVTLGWQGSGAEPSTEHTNMLSIADSTYWLGLFGLNPRPTNYTSFVDPQLSFLEQLKRNNTIPSLSWGYTAGAQYRLDGVFGSLTLGGVDENRFTRHNISWDFYSDIERDMLVTLQAVTTDQGSPSDLLPDGPIAIFLDSTVPHLWMPESACSAFEEAFDLEWDDDSGLYLLNGSQHESLTSLNPSVTLTLGTSDASTISSSSSSSSASDDQTLNITLPYAAFDLNVSYPIVPNSSYYFPLKRAANSTQYTLGRAFFQEAYVIYDYERQNFTVQPCTWDQETLQSTNIKQILSPDTVLPDTNNDNDGAGDGSLAAGAIAGIVVGAIALVALALALCFFLRRRRRNNQAHNATAVPTRSSSSSSSSSGVREAKPKISAPLGGELSSSAEIHEMGQSPNSKPFAAAEMDSPHKLDDPGKAGYAEAPPGSGSGFFGHGKGGAFEVGGGQHGAEGPVFELPGSGVQELEGDSRRRFSYEK